ncbi:MAG: transposase [Deltaproteobacteria bacterium]|jgi:REP element-mobilizing transposase RayT/predicted HTH domain antitoxin|nr:transposase [Deltaproteobacteria bacterium]
MPRRARLDAPGTLHHVIVRGIEKRRIVDDVADRKNFVERLGKLADETETNIYAWALMTNHAHILLRSSEIGLSGFMRRLLTGYAIYYNRRHRRWGHLFQNRYKSIICDEDAYFEELVRYIHLNPLRAQLVKSLAQLEGYRWCGHGAIIGKINYDWQDRDYVLSWFGAKEGAARNSYRHYVEKAIHQGRRPELVGGGLIRSLGGWSAVKAMHRTGERALSDERILGSGKFVEQIIKEAEAKIKHQLPVLDQPEKIDVFISSICQKEKVSIDELKGGSRRREASRVRALIAIGLVKTHGVSLAEAARQLGVSTSAISQIIRRADQ